MARYVVATHRALVARDWVCQHCEAYGKVAVNAKGKARRRVWLWMDESASDAAHDAAAASLESDATRIVDLIRCPTCGKRQPGAAFATLWHGFPDLFIGLGGGAFATILLSDRMPVVIAIPVGLAIATLVLMFGNERRRWREAAHAPIALLSKPATEPKRAAKLPPPIAAPRTTGPTADPFRAPPAPPPIAVERPPVATAAPVVASPDDEKPKFLT